MPKLAKLYAISQSGLDDKSLIEKTKILLENGVKLLQYREKNQDITKMRHQIEKLKKLTDTYGAKLIINDYVDLAIEFEADGVHLGDQDQTVEQAYQKMKSKLTEFSIGVSCYNQIERIEKSLKNPKIDLISIGALFASSTKTDAKKADKSLVIEALKLKNKLKVKTKIYAIGGINTINAPELITISFNNLSLNGLCVCADLYQAKNPAKNCQQLIKLTKNLND